MQPNLRKKNKKNLCIVSTSESVINPVPSIIVIHSTNTVPVLGSSKLHTGMSVKRVGLDCIIIDRKNIPPATT